MQMHFRAAAALFLALVAPAGAQYNVIGPGSCGLGQAKCHTEENSWWVADDHYISADQFFTNSPPPDMRRILANYGITLELARRGNSPCMACHSTIVAARKTEEAETGVACEGCHGPGSGYKDPHAVESPAFGPGPKQSYTIGVKNGMRANEDIGVRARMCAHCHFITDQKLISAGHPTGEDFDYVKGMTKVARHWQRPPEPGDELRPVFASVIGSLRGKIIRNEKPAIVAVQEQQPQSENSLPPAPPPAVVQETEKPITQVAQKEPATKEVKARESKEPAFLLPAPREIIGDFRLPDSLSAAEKLLRIKLRLDALLQKHGRGND